MFGAAPSAGVQGTASVPFQVTRKQDGTTHINFQSITAMPQYENKSFEELRLEDYMSGNKGGGSVGGSSGFGQSTSTGFGAPAAPSGGLFGSPAPAPSGGLFGAPAPAPSAFGSTAPAPSSGFGFGSPAPAPSGGLFGSPAPAPSGGLFGAPAPATGGMFGSTSAPAPSFGGFGAAKPPATGGLFGAPAPAPSGGLFGAPAPAPTAFGTTAPAPTSSGFSFGSTPAPAPAGGLFGASPAPATATSGFSFGGASAPAPSTGLFGSAPAPSTSGGLFGGSTPAPATGGLFGSTPTPATTSGGLFGGSSFSSTTAPTPSGGLFGSAAPAPSGGLFGASTSSQQGGLFQSAATTTSSAATNTILIPPSSETLLAQQMAAIETQSKDLAVLEAWRQGSSSSQKSKQKSLTSSSIGQSNYYRGTSMTIGSPYSTYKSPGVKSVTKIRPRGFGPTPTKSSLASLGTSSPGLLSPSAYLGSATKQLIINPDAYAHKPKVRLLLTDDSSSGKENKSTINDSPSQRMLQIPLPSNGEIPLKESHATPDQSQNTSPGSTKQQSVESKPDSFSKNPAEIDESYDFYQKVVGSNKPSSLSKPSGSKEKKTFAPSLTKAGYTCFPPLETLSKMSEADLAAVSNFVVERIGVGSVAWDGAVDVRDVDLDSVVTIENKAVEVYHREEELGTKPSVGTKLNRPAVITLHGVYSKNGPNAATDEKEKFELKIAKKTKELGAELIMIDSDEGIWKIKVMHFSRYALDDDSDDDIDDLVENTEEGSTTDFQLGVRGGRTQVSNDSSWLDLEGSKTGSQGFSRIIVPENDDEVMEESRNLLLKEPDAKLSTSAADNAYSFISESKLRWTESEDEETTPKSMFSVEGACNTEYARNKVICSVLHDSQVSNINYSANIAAKCAISRPTSSATDFGMRLGRSFRVGWRCDGSYVHPTTLDSEGEKLSKILSFSRPILDENEVSAKDDLLSIHLKYSSFTTDDTDAPIFSLSCNSDKTVQAAMREYSESLSMRLASGSKVENTVTVASEAFSLIDVLFRRIGGQETDELHRRDQAFGIWLKDLCSHEAHSDLKSGEQDRDLLTAVFSALSSGNKWKASNIAQEAGFHTLALMIANSNNSARSSLTTQIEAWKASGAFRHVPSELLRIQYILTSDLSMEEALYQESNTSTTINSGWKHRFASLFQSISNESTLPDTSRIIVARNRYKSDVERGVAPECHSWFVDSNGYECIDEYQTVLVRIMDLFDANKTGAGHISLSAIVNPKGHNPNFFDTSTSFHLASVLSSLRVCDDLSDGDEHALLDSYATQLLSAGMWEWAVYVSLCTFKKNELCPFVIQHKVAMAKRIINSQYPSSTTLEAKNKRKFLEDTLKIPSSWFNDSFAIYCISTFNVKGYFEVVTQSSMEDALRVYEESILTDSLFEGGRENCYLLLQVLNTLKPGEHGSSLSLSKVVCDYLSLLRDVGIYLSDDQTDYTSSNLLSRIQMIQLDLIKLESDCRTESSWKSFSALPVTPRSVVLKELLKSVIYMMAQIEGRNRLQQKHQPSATGIVPALSALNENFQFEKSDLDCRALLRAKFPLKMSCSDGDTIFVPKLYRT
jgi:nuclear pore complex protein Nup98-Nup96